MSPKAKLKRTGGGAFDPTEQNIYFIASGAERLRHAAAYHRHLLIAINEIDGESQLRTIRSWLDGGCKVFIDSGIYDLAMTHARKTGVTMDEALSTPPEAMPDFPALFEKYVRIVRQLEDRVWGYIELDQGGRENKIKTRARLESLGLRPIPVYHPLTDGWDYFDYLAERYDRICFGNIVQADANVRKRLLATAWERHRKYPHLWIHLLGLTPNQVLNAYPINSADSSSWLAAVRWASSDKEKAALAPLGALPVNFRYQLGGIATAPTGSHKAISMSAYRYRMMLRNWRNHIDELKTLGCEVYDGYTS